MGKNKKRSLVFFATVTSNLTVAHLKSHLLKLNPHKFIEEGSLYTLYLKIYTMIYVYDIFNIQGIL